MLILENRLLGEAFELLRLRRDLIKLIWFSLAVHEE